MMINLKPGTQVYLYCQTIDLRKAFNGLAALVANAGRVRVQTSTLGARSGLETGARRKIGFEAPVKLFQRQAHAAAGFPSAGPP